MNETVLMFCSFGVCAPLYPMFLFAWLGSVFIVAAIIAVYLWQSKNEVGAKE